MTIPTILMSFTLLMWFVATVCVVWAVIVYRDESLKWRRFVAAVGSEEGAIAAIKLLEADTDNLMRDGMKQGEQK